jgi:hypothetical protein
MRILSILLSGILVFCITSKIHAQKDCKVNKLGIEVSYEGDCNKGLAHGEGIAKGEDTYKGTFRKGLPNGYGEYLWANGDIFKGEWKKGLKEGKGELKLIRSGKDSLLIGFWKKDKYVGQYEKAYEVITKTPEIVSVNFINKGEGSELILLITKGQTPISPSGLTVTGQYGAGTPVNRATAFRQIEFPWQGSIRFSYNDLGLKSPELVVKINTPGIWEIRIDLRFTR